MNTPLRLGSLCSGYGGLDMAARAVLGGELAFVADPDPGATRILTHHHPDVPNLGDIRAVDWDLVEPVDILTAGFPCQDISTAGKQAGIKEGTRSGIWSNVADAVRVLRPRLLCLENVSALATRGFDRVITDLAEIGYDAAWTCLRAADVGAPHRRERIFILAWPSNTQNHRLPRPRSARAGWDGSENRGLPAAHPGHRNEPDRARTERGTPREREAVRDEPRSAREWGIYSAAITRWEQVIGRAAPVPSEPGRSGRPRLSPVFVEWLMGLDPGYVTDPDIGLTRTQQLHALGNGVVPQQGARALRLLLEHATTPVPA